MTRLPFLTPEKALVFRIVHIDNLPWILRHGLHCRNATSTDPAFREIGNPDLIAKRAHRNIPIGPGGTLSDYVPFYFTPRSPMLFNLKTGWNVARVPMRDIAVLVSSLPTLVAQGIPFVFSDRHAYLAAARFSADLRDLDRIDWPRLQACDFKRDPDEPDKFERYEAEALVHRQLPVAALLAIAGSHRDVEDRLRAMVDAAGVPLQIVIRPGWFF